MSTRNAHPQTAVEPLQHDIIWSPERIRRFWDYNGSNNALEDTYFSRLRGRALVDFVSRRIRIGVALDLGCGRGDLVGYLLEKHQAGGVDQSPDSVATVKRRFDNHPNFRGARTNTDQLGDASVDTIFIVEVVEHLDDRTLASVLSEARRLLRPGGHLVLTTPNEEDLEASKVMCPECAAVFHRWQHVRSWSPESLVAHVRSFGFEGQATPTLLSQNIGLNRVLQRTIYWFRGDRLPHMVYIGARTT